MPRHTWRRAARGLALGVLWAATVGALGPRALRGGCATEHDIGAPGRKQAAVGQEAGGRGSVCDRTESAAAVAWERTREQTMELREPLRTADPTAPAITRRDVLNCQIEQWYPLFSKHTLKTKFVELSPAFVQYLLSDGLILPQGCEAPSSHSGRDADDDSWGDFTDEDSDCEAQPLLSVDSAASNGEERQGQATRLQFDELVEAMTKAIEELGGEVSPNPLPLSFWSSLKALVRMPALLA